MRIKITICKRRHVTILKIYFLPTRYIYSTIYTEAEFSQDSIVRLRRHKQYCLGVYVVMYQSMRLQQLRFDTLTVDIPVLVICDRTVTQIP